MSSADKLARLKVNSGGPRPDLGKITSLRQRTPVPAAERAPLPATASATLVKKGIQLPPEVVKQFELLRAERGQKGYELWAEAVNLLLEAHGHDPVKVSFLDK